MPPEIDYERVAVDARRFVQGSIVRFEHSIWLADPQLPLTSRSGELSEDAASGIEVIPASFSEWGLILTQSCDLMETKATREFVAICPVVERSGDQARLALAGHQPREIPVPWHPESTTAGGVWVALPSLVTTAERSVLVSLPSAADPSELERRALAEQLGRFFSHAAIPGEVIDMLRPLAAVAKKYQGKANAQGRVMNAVKEIRVAAEPDSDRSPPWQVTLIFVVDPAWLPDEPKQRQRGRGPTHDGNHYELLDALITKHSGLASQERATALWQKIIKDWMSKVAIDSHYVETPLRTKLCHSLTPREYQTSDRLDLNYLTLHRR